MLRRILIPFLCLLGLFCTLQAQDAPALKIAALHPILGDMARAIGGSHVQVADLLLLGGLVLDRPVQDEIRVATDRRGEVSVGLQGQAEVTDVVGLIDGLTHGAQQHGGEQFRIRAPFEFGGQVGKVLRLGLQAPLELQTQFGQIRKALNRMHADYAKPVDITSLASEAGMSVSTFHGHFKAVTSSPPLQYLKSIRLQKARMLMAHEGLTASIAAREVGYESASQFSREFKRYFGNTPAAVAEEMRAAMIRL